MKNPNNIVLFGMKNAGKSTTAKVLAKENKMDLLKLDDLIEETYFKLTGEKLSFREIFKKEGAEFFRKFETQVLENLKEKGITNTVIDVGGGTPMNEKNREILRYIGECIWLKLDKEKNYERIVKNGIPAFFKYMDDPKKSFQELVEERFPVYKEFADKIIKFKDESPLDIVNLIFSKLK